MKPAKEFIAKARGFWRVSAWGLVNRRGRRLPFGELLPICKPVKGPGYAAVLNGVAAVPLLFLILSIATGEKIMGQFKSGWLSTLILWTTFIAMAAAAIALFYTMF